MNMKLVFDLTFDDGTHPGPLADREAVAGEKWVGPHGLLGVLETVLGLGGPTFTQSERTAALIPVLAATDGFWGRSFETDAFATASEVMRWRDMLCIGGWNGDGKSERLIQLAYVSRAVMPGYPDRLVAVAKALSSRRTDIQEIKRIKPVDDLPGLWAVVFERIASQGTTVEDVDLDTVGAHGNLEGARSPGFEPCPVDDSLQLLRSTGPLDAAERVAAWLRGTGDLASTVIVGCDELLDAALRRYGLPTTGASMGVGGDALLQILPLVLACGWGPPDPLALLQLLMLPVSPVPRRLAGGLADALHEWPAMGSARWMQALQDGLAAIDDADRRARVGVRMNIIFSQAAKASLSYPAEEICKRASMLLAWMQARKENAGDGGVEWDSAIAQCSILVRLIKYSELGEFPDAQLRRIVQQATSDAPASPVYPAQAGVIHVGDPGCMAGPARRVVWWGFTQDGAPAVLELPLHPAEREELSAAGVVLPDPGLSAVRGAERWQRPLHQAAEALVLVCPRKDVAGEDLYPHPLWDVILGRLADGHETVEPLIRQTLSPDLLTRSQRTLMPVPASQREWHSKVAIPLRECESPSGAGDLVGCPLKWVLNYVCRVHGGRSATLPGDSQLWGSMLHEILSQVLNEGAESATGAKARAEGLFDELGPRLAAPLFLPGADAEQVSVRRAAGLSAQQIWQMLHDSGGVVLASEEEYSGAGLGRKMTGRPDLVVSNPMRIIDLKWRGRSFRTGTLENGTAYQLAAYGHLASETDEEVLPGAYFILSDQVLITSCIEAFPSCQSVMGPTPVETWKALGKSYGLRCNELLAGDVMAEAITDAEGNGPAKPGIDGERGMMIDPPCKFCDYGLICGNGFEVTS
jgi:hypothetical protein